MGAVAGFHVVFLGFVLGGDFLDSTRVQPEHDDGHDESYRVVPLAVALDHAAEHVEGLFVRGVDLAVECELFHYAFPFLAFDVANSPQETTNRAPKCQSLSDA